MKPLVIIDLYALVHPLANSAFLDADLLTNWVPFFANPVNYLPYTPLGSPFDFYPVLVSDLKATVSAIQPDGSIDQSKTDKVAKTGYWRHAALGTYKGNRKPTDKSITNIARYIKDAWRGAGLTLLEQPGFEADDFASMLCRNYPTTPKYLMTLDSDWSGLVDDYTYWIDTYAQNPKYYKPNRLTILDAPKMLDRFNNHKDFKRKYVLEKPSDIWLAKAKLGDTSDSVGGSFGGDIGLIDLKNPTITPNDVEFDPERLTNLLPNYRLSMFGVPDIDWVD